MTEAEIMVLRSGLTGLVISVVSVSFGMISAYIAGLWLFLKTAPIALRALAFLLLSCGLAFMGVVTWGLHGLLVGTDRAWEKIASPTSEIVNFGGQRPEILQGFSLYEFGAGLGFLAFFSIYLTLAYLTFVFRWARVDGVGDASEM